MLLQELGCDALLHAVRLHEIVEIEGLVIGLKASKSLPPVGNEEEHYIWLMRCTEHVDGLREQAGAFEWPALASRLASISGQISHPLLPGWGMPRGTRKA